MNLADLRALNVDVSLSQEGKLRLRAAPGVLTAHLKQAIVEAKPRLLEELRGLRQAPVNVVNMVNFDAHCLTAGIGPSTASQNDHRASAPEPVTVLKQPGALLDGGLSSEGEATVLAWLECIGESEEAIVGDVLAQCRHDADARQYFLGRASECATDDIDERRYCDQCGNWRSGVCVVAKPGGVVSANSGYRSATSVPQRCLAFVPAH